MLNAREVKIKSPFPTPLNQGIKHFYKYRSMDLIKLVERLEKTFTNQEIYFPNPSLFNDPYECKPKIIVYKSGIKRKNFIRDLVKRLWPDLNKNERRRREVKVDINMRSDPLLNKKAYEIFLKDIGLYCLSEIRDDILMWSHYANGHRGLCLEFDTSIKLKDIYSTGQAKNVIFGQAQKVNYSFEYPSVNIMNFGSEEYSKALLTKSNHWEYEKEWRIISPKDKGGPGLYYFQPELLTGVILGALISPEHKKLILDWTSNYPSKILVYEARISNTKYELEITSLS